MAWDYLKRFGRAHGGRFHEGELRCDLPNGARMSCAAVCGYVAQLSALDYALNTEKPLRIAIKFEECTSEGSGHEDPGQLVTNRFRLTLDSLRWTAMAASSR